MNTDYIWKKGGSYKMWYLLNPFYKLMPNCIAYICVMLLIFSDWYCKLLIHMAEHLGLIFTLQNFSIIKHMRNWTAFVILWLLPLSTLTNVPFLCQLHRSYFVHRSTTWRTQQTKKIPAKYMYFLHATYSSLDSNSFFNKTVWICFHFHSTPQHGLT